VYPKFTLNLLSSHQGTTSNFNNPHIEILCGHYVICLMRVFFYALVAVRALGKYACNDYNVVDELKFSLEFGNPK
jgi:hypothetical protein